MERIKIFYGTLLFLCTAFAVATDAASASASEETAVIEAMLDNIHAHGFNHCAQGLYINWDSQAVNYNGTGSPDVNPCQRHDRLTDLRYLANLWRYRTISKSTRYDTDITTFTPIVLKEFQKADPRGWVYNEFKDLAALSGDARYTAETSRILASYAKAPSHPDRIDWVIEQGAALVQSGVPEYQAVGRQRIDSALSAYFSGKYHLVLWGKMEIKTSEQLDIAIALARAGYTSQAKEMVIGLQTLWDQRYDGYVEGADISSGNLQLKTKKTGGRMAAAVELAGLLGDESLLKDSLSVLYTKAYLPKFKGVVYEQHQDWSLYIINRITEDWVTSEAMGLTLEALLKHREDAAN